MMTGAVSQGHKATVFRHEHLLRIPADTPDEDGFVHVQGHDVATAASRYQLSPTCNASCDENALKVYEELLSRSIKAAQETTSIIEATLKVAADSELLTAENAVLRKWYTGQGLELPTTEGSDLAAQPSPEGSEASVADHVGLAICPQYPDHAEFLKLSNDVQGKEKAVKEMQAKYLKTVAENDMYRDQNTTMSRWYQGYQARESIH
jgi:hypothetical protein